MLSDRTRVYVAGPLSQGDVALNVRNAVITGGHLLDRGYAPYVPHLTHFFHMIAPKPYEEWMRLDREWLLLCHAMIRLPGESPGSERDMAWAAEAGIPVFLNLPDLFAKVPSRNPPNIQDRQLYKVQQENLQLRIERDALLLGTSKEEYMARLEQYQQALTPT